MRKITTIPPSRDMLASHIEGGRSWDKELEKTEKGQNCASLTNVISVVMAHPFLRDCFAWSEVEEDVMVMRELPRYGEINPPKSASGYPCKLDNKHSVYMRCLMNTVVQCNFKTGDISDGLVTVAMQRTYHPIRTYLKSLEWDETPRLTEWLRLGFGADSDPMTSSMAFMFLIAAVRRVIFRRYKFDSMLVLEGPKGIKKSSGLRELYGDDCFLEGIDDIRKLETTKALAGKWGVEIPEGKGFLKADAATQKAFLSQVEDTYRRAFDKRDTAVPRTVTFVMTVNDYDYMIDGIGDRRFWPVRCGVTSAKCNIQWIKENRDQLWAEAFSKAIERNEDGSLRYKTYMEEPEMEALAESQQERVVTDPWEDMIRGRLIDGEGKDMPSITSLQIMNDILDISPERRDRSAQMKISRIMRDMGWKKARSQAGGSRSHQFIRP